MTNNDLDKSVLPQYICPIQMIVDNHQLRMQKWAEKFIF